MPGTDGFVWPPGPPERPIGRPSQSTPNARPTAIQRITLDAPAPERGWFGCVERELFGSAGIAEAWKAEVALQSGAAACWRCASPVGPGEVDSLGCGWCRPKRLGYSRSVALGIYDGALREALHDLKYHASRATGLGVGRELGRAVQAMLDREGVDTDRVVLVPVPATTRRRMLRNKGIDHALTLARAVGQETGCRVARVLGRVHRASQTAVPSSRRASNVRGAFRVRTSWDDRDLDRVVLIDDVRTTGATLTACCRALSGMIRGDGVRRGDLRRRLWAATVAVSVDDRRRGAGELAESGRNAKDHVPKA